MIDHRQTVRAVDSHHHFWDTSRRDYPWLAGLTAIERSFGPDDLRPLLKQNGVDATVLVQTVSVLDETREFLEIAGTTDFVAGVVGWVDLTDPQVSTTLAELQDGPHGEYLVGIRHQVHDEEDPDWLLREDVQHGLNEVAGAGLTYDLLLRTRELPAGITVARDFPHLRLVIDHIAKPPIAEGDIDAWSALMHEFAGLEHVACKLSGMVTEAYHDRWTPDDLQPYVQVVHEVFGPQRLMFGSDWPVCLLAAEYGEVIETLKTVLSRIESHPADPEAERAIWGGTAMHWYGLHLG